MKILTRALDLEYLIGVIETLCLLLVGVMAALFEAVLSGVRRPWDIPVVMTIVMVVFAAVIAFSIYAVGFWVVLLLRKAVRWAR